MFGGLVTSLQRLDDLRESCFNKCEGEPCVGGGGGGGGGGGYMDALSYQYNFYGLLIKTIQF